MADEDDRRMADDRMQDFLGLLDKIRSAPLPGGQTRNGLALWLLRNMPTAPLPDGSTFFLSRYVAMVLTLAVIEGYCRGLAPRGRSLDGDVIDAVTTALAAADAAVAAEAFPAAVTTQARATAGEVRAMIERVLTDPEAYWTIDATGAVACVGPQRTVH